MGTQEQGAIDDLHVLVRGHAEGLGRDDIDRPQHATGELVEHPERVGREQLGPAARLRDALPDVRRRVLGGRWRQLDLRGDPGQQRPVDAELQATVQLGEPDQDARLARGHVLAGEDVPLVPNDSDENKEKNRRVEFIIVEQDEVKQVVEIDPETGEERVVEEKTQKVAR